MRGYALLGYIMLLCLVGGCARPGTTTTQAGSSVARAPWVLYVTVSPDGKNVAFDYITHRGDPHPRHEIWAMTVHGGSPHPVCTSKPGESICERAAWLPDSQHLVYSFLSRSRSDLVIASADGTDRRWLTNTPADVELWPVPSPRGGWIAYCRAGREPGKVVSELWIVRSDGDVARHVATSQAAPSAFVPTWNNDGSVLFFLAVDEAGQRNIKAARLENGRIRSMTTLFTSKRLCKFCISRDGTHIAYALYASEGQGGDTGELFIADMRSPANPKPLAASVDLYSLSWAPWAPDSSSLYFLRPGAADGTLWRIDLHSGAETRVAANVRELARLNAWTIAGEIVFVRDGNQIWVVNSNGTVEKQIFPQHTEQ